MTDHLKSISEATFDAEVLQSKIPVLVDFWAEWCGPCKSMQPALEEAAENYAGEVKIVKVNITDNETMVERFGARSIPLFVMFDGGAEKARVMGAMSKTRLCSFIDANIQES